MEYEIISPLGKRKGLGTYETVWDERKFKKMQDAIASNEYVVVDFVRNKDGIIYFKFEHARRPDKRLFKKLEIQHFPFGIDVFDDEMAMNYAKQLLNLYERIS